MNPRNSKKVIFLMLTLFLFLGMSVREAQTFYACQKKIWVNAGQVSNGPLSDFPLLFSVTDPDLKTAANGGHVQNANGYDIVFRDSTGAFLDYEVEQYDGTTGQLIAWVRVPSIDNGTLLWIQYGDATISSSQQNKTGVWGTDYGAVWHLAETSNPYNDSTSNGNNSASGTYPTQATGKIGKGQTFSGAQSISIPATSSIELTTDGTVSVWFNPSNVSADYDIIEKGGNYGYTFWPSALPGYSGMWWGPQNASVGNWAWSTTPLTQGQWYKLDGVTSGGIMYLYSNGSLIAQSSAYYSFSNAASLQIGNGVDGYAQGTIDEVRVSTTKVRTAGWILTEYNNQSNPSNFYTVASEETLITLLSFTAYPQGNAIQVDWVTKTEIDNLGFNLYRSTNSGPYTQLNQRLIPGLVSSIAGRSYTYTDTGAKTPVCYVLEDIDLSGTRTSHGPACVYALGGQAGGGTGAAQGSPGATPGTGSGSTPGGGSAGGIAPPGQPSPVRTGSVTSVTLTSLGAQTDGTGVLVTWTTGEEVNNLGFNVYRQKQGHRVKLTRAPLAGSALKTGGAYLAAGHAYRFVDPEVGSAYWVEDIDLNGTRTLHGPVTPTPSATPLLKVGSRSLSGLTGDQQSTAQEALAARIGQKRSPGGFAARPFSGALMSPEDTQRALAASQAVKLFIRDAGWYRVPLADLAALGLPVGNPPFLQLYAGGKEEPLLIEDGAVAFYGRGIDTPYTDTNVYWLVQGARPGKRIQNAAGAGKTWMSQEYFPATVTLRERTIYFAALLNGDDENFFGSVIGADPVEKELAVSHRAGGAATLTVLLQGVTLQPHEVTVTFNGQVVGNLSFSGQHQGEASFTIPEAALADGANTVTLQASGELDVSMIDTLELTYWRTYTADQDRLAFTAEGGQQVTIGGFTTRQVRVMDVTNPKAVTEVTGKVKPTGAGYAIQIGVPGHLERTLIAFTGSALSPAALAANEPSAWYTSAGADLVMVSHHDFISRLTPLKALREQTGLSVAVVDIEDVYDEYSFGVKTPYALKDFMTRAGSWRRAPQYLLLVGDASMDPKNYLGLGSFDLVPTKLVDATYLETASDDWFVDLNGDLLPAIPIGRLPVRTSDEAALVVAKLTGYAQTQQGRGALVVADQATAADAVDFAAVSDRARALLPERITAQTFYRGTLDDGTLTAAFIAAFNQGPLLVNYVGHGSVEIWDGALLTTPAAETLANGTTLPLVVAMTCLNGLFQDVHTESLAEALLLAPRGGAVAVFASSGLTRPEPQSIMNQEFIRLLFNGRPLTVGQAAVGAKEAVIDPDVRKTWIFFGDPAMRLR